MSAQIIKYDNWGALRVITNLTTGYVYNKVRSFPVLATAGFICKVEFSLQFLRLSCQW